MSRRWSTMLAAASGVCGMICLAGLGSALAADTFDGVYTGRRAVEKGAGPRCEGSENYRWPPTKRPHELPAAPRRVIQPTIKGRIVGDVLDADVSNEPCAFHWHLTKKPRGE